MDVTLKLKEQNRNQLTFGAGVSQYEGVFGQLAFQTANFLGRGESLTVSLQAGDRAQNYQLAFTEPFLFDRNITGGFDVYKRALQYIGYYTQKSTGGNLMFGFPVADFSRMFVNYAYEQVRMTDLNEAFIDPSCVCDAETGCSTISLDRPVDRSSSGGAREPPPQSVRVRFAAARRRRPPHGQQGRPDASCTTRSTTRSSRTPASGSRRRSTWRCSAATRSSTSRRIEGIRFWRHTSRTSFGIRGQYAVHRAGRRHDDAADLREAVPGRRVQRPRLRHPVDRPVRSVDRSGARRQQEPAVQRRVPVLDRVAGPR